MKQKLSILFILISCFFRFLTRGRAVNVSPRIKKIIVSQTAKLGDMVCTTPVFKAIKDKYPGAKLYVLGNKINKELLEGNALVDGYVERAGVRELKKVIRAEEFDVGISVVPSFTVLTSFYLAGVPLIVVPEVRNGRSPYETRSYKILRKLVETRPHNMGQYAPREYLRLLEPLGIFSENTAKYLSFSKEAGAKIDELLQNNSLAVGRDFLVGISPSTGNKVKQWAPEKFAAVADYLIQRYEAKMVVIGSKGDKEAADRMVEKTDQSSLILNTQGILNLDELKALISKMSLVIGVDTGPIYIAEAFNVPTIDVVGPMDEREQPPQGRVHKIVKLENRIPQLHIMNARVYDQKAARRQIEEIPVEMVKAAIDQLLPLLKTR